METKSKIKILNNFYLPVEIKKVTNNEYKLVKREYSKEELEEKILNELKEQMKSEIENKEIVNEHFTTEQEGEKIKVKLLYEVIEKIGTEEKLVS